MAMRTIAAEEFEPEQVQGSATSPELTPPPMLTPIAKRTIKASEFEPEKPLSAQTTTFQQPEVPAPSTTATPATPDVTRYESSMPFHELEQRRLDLIERPKKEVEEGLTSPKHQAEMAKQHASQVENTLELEKLTYDWLIKAGHDPDEAMALTMKASALLQPLPVRQMTGPELIEMGVMETKGGPGGREIKIKNDPNYVYDIHTRKLDNSIVSVLPGIHVTQQGPLMYDPNSSTGVSQSRLGISGTPVTQNPAIVPSMAPTTREYFMKVRQPDGSDKVFRVTSVTSKGTGGEGASPAAPVNRGPITEELIQKTITDNKDLNPSREIAIKALEASGYGTTGSQGTPPPATPPAKPHAQILDQGTVVGGQALTPEQRSTEKQTQAALGNTMDIMARMYKNIPLLDNALTAGKIWLASDSEGVFKPILARGVTLSKDEVQLAADLKSMSEHINTLRKPLGATGFRSLESFINLMAQGGRPLDRPDITKSVLENTMPALLKQKAIHDQTLTYPGKPELDQTTANIYYLINDKNPTAALAAAERDGYNVPRKK